MRICFCIFCSTCWSLIVYGQLQINLPSIADEATSIWRTINDIEFLEQQGYTMHLPQSDLIDTLIQKSKNGQFGNEDYARIYELMENGHYEMSNYEIAVRKVTEQQELVNDLIQQVRVSKENWDWSFAFFESYPVVFTLYGTGGSYDPNTGQITLMTTADGAFKKYTNPAYTIIHEIIHMGIESSIVQKHRLIHADKERLVDRLVLVLFGQYLPDYEVQNMGNMQLDKAITHKNDIKELDTIIAQFMK